MKLANRYVRIANWAGGTGLVWMVVRPDGKEERTIYAASGRDAFKKSQIARMFEPK